MESKEEKKKTKKRRIESKEEKEGLIMVKGTSNSNGQVRVTRISNS